MTRNTIAALAQMISPNRGTEFLSSQEQLRAYAHGVHGFTFCRVGISIVLIAVNIRKTFFYDYDKLNDVEAAIWLPDYLGLPFDIKPIFQVAAKVYEVLMFASLSQVALSIVQVYIVQHKAPLGLPTAGY